MKNVTWLVVLFLVLWAAGCGPAMADTTPPDLTKQGYTQQNNPDFKAAEVVSLLAAVRLLSPGAAATVGVIQTLGGCLVDAKVAQWAIYTDPKNKATVGLVLKASKNGLTDPTTITKCLASKVGAGAASAQPQFCAQVGQYVDAPTKDTVYVAYAADEPKLCNAISSSMPPLQGLSALLRYEVAAKTASED